MYFEKFKITRQTFTATGYERKICSIISMEIIQKNIVLSVGNKSLQKEIKDKISFKINFQKTYNLCQSTIFSMRKKSKFICDENFSAQFKDLMLSMFTNEKLTDYSALPLPIEFSTQIVLTRTFTLIKKKKKIPYYMISARNKMKQES